MIGHICTKTTLLNLLELQNMICLNIHSFGARVSDENVFSGQSGPGRCKMAVANVLSHEEETYCATRNGYRVDLGANNKS